MSGACYIHHTGAEERGLKVAEATWSAECGHWKKDYPELRREEISHSGII